MLLTIKARTNGILVDALLELGAVIAGGYARYKTIVDDFTHTIEYGDIDVWTFNEEDYAKVIERMNEQPARKAQSPNGWRYSYAFDTYNIIRPDVRRFETVEGLLRSFDFTVTQAALVAPNVALVTEEFLRDVVNNQVYLTSYERDPLETTRRVIKYAKKGFTIHPTVITKLFLVWDKLKPEEKYAAIANYTEFTESTYVIGTGN